ncbi:MAG: glycosyltransferase family 4 protein [Deltaproteobacteria bacterium]|nr:glycosyltransferase family 4 protein [Deltaproteobacteria bacterium]MCL5277166.1 glycosyltransferase family 4 protein [Deltaproteobacteria bacterium]
MKVLLATSSAGWSGGQHQVYLLAKGLRERGNAVSVVTSNDSELGKRLAAESIDVHSFRMNKEADVLTMIKMTSFLKRNGFDIINVHRPTAHTIAMVANILSSRSRFIVTRRVPYGIPSRISAKIKYEWFVDRVIAISNDVRQSLVKTGVREGHIEVIPDAIDTGYYDPARIVPAPELGGGGPVIGTVGNANKQKGHSYFLSAIPAILKRYPGALFVDVGVNDNDRELVERADSLGVRDKIIFAGFQKDVRPYLKAMDVFVFPSVVEGLGTSLLEAMAMQKPVVVSRTGGMVDIISHDKNGIFVRPGSPEDIAEAVCGLLDDVPHALELGRQARNSVEEGFSVEVVTQKTEELFQSVL